MKLQPLSDRVLVKQVQAEEKTKGGIYIPDTAKEKPLEAEVVAVGPGKKDGGTVLAMEVKVGDKVLYGKYAGNEYKVDGEDLIILREDDIVAIIK